MPVTLLLAADKVEADPIRKNDEVCVHSVDRQEILGGTHGRDIRRGASSCLQMRRTAVAKW